MKKYDLIVAGGGLTGVAAAVSAARLGQNVLLAEKSGWLGGAMSNSLVFPFMRWWTPKAGEEVKELSDGIFTEMRERLGKYALPDKKNHYDPEYFKFVLDDMVEEAGVEVLFHATLCKVNVEGERVKSAVFAVKSGLLEIDGDCFIDATGEADLCRLAGAAMMPAETLQPLSLCFVLEGVDLACPLMRDCIHHTGANGSHSVNCVIHEHLNRCVEKGEIEQFGGPWFNTQVQGHTVAVNVTRRAANAADRADMTRVECLLREDMHRIVAILKRDFPEFKDCAIVSSGVNAGVRETARILGVDTVTGADMLSGQQWPCPVARCAHPMDIHSAKSSAQSLQYFEGAALVPHTALIPRGFDNLLAAGRCVSADATAYASLRVQATVMAIGEAAGLMAAQHVATGKPMAALDAEALKAQIRNAEFGVRN